MKKFLLASIAILGISGAASAADLYVKAPPVVAPIPFSWTGCHIGGHVGYGKGQTSQNVSMDDIPTGGEYHPATNFNNKGGVYGLQGGCDYQWGMFVAGLEGDYSWSKLNASYGFADPVEDAPNVDSFASNSKISSLASIRGRFGIAADRTLVYATMGWAWAKFKYSYVINDNDLPINAASYSTTADGVVVGAGVNYALTNWLILRAEYLHYAVGKDIALVPSTISTGLETGPQFGDRAGITNVDVIRVGADWKFW